MPEPTITADRVYNTMREMIVAGELQPGTRLIQRQLAAQFGTSNIPVVEAIRRLERDSLVVSYPNWGAQVKTWTIEDIEGVYLMREVLEGIACRLFAERATAVEKVTLLEYGAQFDARAEALDEKGCDEADVALHQYIVLCSKSPTLARLAETSCVIATAIKNTFLRLSFEQRVGPVGIHDALIATLNGGDSKAAEQSGREHVLHAFQRLLDHAKAEV